MLDNPWIACLLAMFVWWFSTGAILVVVRLADKGREGAHLRAVLAGLPLFLLAWVGFLRSLEMDGLMGVYLAFFSAIVIWGWFELAFLTGIIAGPNIHPCPDNIPTWERFIRAWGTIAYSEMALIGTLILIIALGWEAVNIFGMWTFIILFFARISAKLNLYLGVPNINTEFLPTPLRHLASHFRQGPMNPLFPISATALTFAVACWVERAYVQPEGSATLIGFALLATLTTLALLEHWMMVLPMQDARLWRWMLPSPEGEAGLTERLEQRKYAGEESHGL